MIRNVIALLALAGLMASCKKESRKRDYVCVCSTLGTPDFYRETYHDKKENAQKKCEELQTSLWEASCELRE